MSARQQEVGGPAPRAPPEHRVPPARRVGRAAASSVQAPILLNLFSS